MFASLGFYESHTFPGHIPIDFHNLQPFFLHMLKGLSLLQRWRTVEGSIQIVQIHQVALDLLLEGEIKLH